MGAIAVPLSFLFGPEALEYRLTHSAAKVAIVDPQSLPNLAPIRERCPGVKHVIGVAGARESYVTPWEDLVAKASSRHEPVATSARDPALIVYTSGTTGPPKAALMPHACLIGNLPGFVHSHDGYPREGDLFWSPADWAWTGGLMDALLPTLYHGQPIVGYRGRFDPERALTLIAKYGIRNAFLFPTALKMMMKAYPRPKERFDVDLRSIMSAGESVGSTVFEWARDALGVTINEMFGQTEMNYIVGNSHELWPAKPGAMGRPYPGHRVAVIDDDGNELPPGEAGEVAVHRIAPDGTPDPVFFLEYAGNPEGTRAKYTGDWWPHRRRRRARRRRRPVVPRPRRRHVQGGRLPDRPVRDRELPRAARRGRERGRRALARRGARQRRQGVHRARARPLAVASARGRDPRARARQARALRVPEGDRVRRRAADDDDGEGAEEGVARAGGAAQGRGTLTLHGHPAHPLEERAGA
jgi:acyl-CoA synthetase (AMP-forming)/AMP-acid ligase II